MNYIEFLRSKNVQVPAYYVEFRATEDFADFNGMVYRASQLPDLSPTTELYFDWDTFMAEEFFNENFPDEIPIAILHDQEFLDDAYFSIRTDPTDKAVYFCKLSETGDELEYEKVSDTLEGFLETLEYPEDNYIGYLESKYSVSLPGRYKSFMQSYEYVTYNGSLQCTGAEVYFDEFPFLRDAAEKCNAQTLEWLPIAMLGEPAAPAREFVAIRVGDESCAVYLMKNAQPQMISSSLNEFIN